MWSIASENFLSVPLLELQVTGGHVIVVKNSHLFVNELAQFLQTPLQPPQFLRKVAAHSNGPNLTQRSELTASL